jgi:hypothetical protein
MPKAGRLVVVAGGGDRQWLPQGFSTLIEGSALAAEGSSSSVTSSSVFISVPYSAFRPNSRRQRAVKVRQRRDPATRTPPVGSARGMRSAAGRFVSRRKPVRDLLLRAKHLFVAAISVGGCSASPDPSARCWHTPPRRWRPPLPRQTPTPSPARVAAQGLRPRQSRLAAPNPIAP